MQVFHMSASKFQQREFHGIGNREPVRIWDANRHRVHQIGHTEFFKSLLQVSLTFTPFTPLFPLSPSFRPPTSYPTISLLSSTSIASGTRLASAKRALRCVMTMGLESWEREREVKEEKERERGGERERGEREREEERENEEEKERVQGRGWRGG